MRSGLRIADHQHDADHQSPPSRAAEFRVAVVFLGQKNAVLVHRDGIDDAFDMARVAREIVRQRLQPVAYRLLDLLLLSGGHVGGVILATIRSLGVYAIAIWTSLFTSLIWLAVDVGIIERLTTGTFATLALVVLANVLGVWVSWSYIRGRLSGQQDTNDVT